MKITDTHIQELERLSRLKLTDVQRHQFAEQLTSVLEYVETVQSVDVEGVDELNQPVDLSTTLREDEKAPVDINKRAALITSFPEHVGDLLVVPAVFENKE